MEVYPSYEDYLKSADTDKLKLDFIIWYYKLKYLILIFFLGGGMTTIYAIISKNVGLGFIGFLSFVVSLIISILYNKANSSDKYSIALTLLMIANSIESYKKMQGALKDIRIRKKILFFLRYINQYFEGTENIEFFDKNEHLFKKINSLVKKINFALSNSQINKYDAAEIKKFAYQLYTENEKIYTDIDKILNKVRKEAPFKSLSDYIKKFLGNKYAKFTFFEILIIGTVIISHLLFPIYVEKDKVFWAIIILTGVNLTINFAKK